MANEGAYGGLSGMAAGAALGSVIPGLGTLAGAGIGGALGGTLGGLFSKGPKAPDISGELANISALFAKLRAQAQANVNQNAADARMGAASNLAARGIYRAPVSENTFNLLERDRQRNLASVDADLAGQEAQVRARLMSQLLGYDYQNSIMAREADAARTGAITGLGANLAFAKLLQGQGGGFGNPRMTGLPASTSTMGYTV